MTGPDTTINAAGLILIGLAAFSLVQITHACYLRRWTVALKWAATFAGTAALLLIGVGT